MDFDELCKDFDRQDIGNLRRSGTEKGIEPLVSIPWGNGSLSSNDVLVHWLIAQGIEYIHDFNGTVWFLWGGEWTRSKVRCDRKNSILHFSRCIF